MLCSCCWVMNSTLVLHEAVQGGLNGRQYGLGRQKWQQRAMQCMPSGYAIDIGLMAYRRLLHASPFAR